MRLRYYHNINQRLDINKNVVGNSANYFAAAQSIFGEPLRIVDNMPDTGNWAFAFYGAMYGIQRTNRKGFNINANLAMVTLEETDYLMVLAPWFTSLLDG